MAQSGNREETSANGTISSEEKRKKDKRKNRMEKPWGEGKLKKEKKKKETGEP